MTVPEATDKNRVATRALEPDLGASKALFVRPGTAEQWRVVLDARGQYGTAIYETSFLPAGTEAVEANLDLMRHNTPFAVFEDIIASRDA